MISPMVGEICGLWSCNWQGFSQFLLNLFVRLFIGNPLSVLALLIFIPIMLLAAVWDFVDKILEKKESNPKSLVSPEEAKTIGRTA